MPLRPEVLDALVAAGATAEQIAAAVKADMEAEEAERAAAEEARRAAECARRQHRAKPKDWWRMWGLVMRRDNRTCRYCGGRATEVDHVIPHSRGGPDDPENLVAACKPCNSSKQDKLLSEWSRTCR